MQCYSAPLHSTLLYSTLLYSALLCSTLLYYTALYNICCTIPYYTILCTTWYYSDYSILQYTKVSTLQSTVLYSTTLQIHAMSFVGFGWSWRICNHCNQFFFNGWGWWKRKRLRFFAGPAALTFFYHLLSISITMVLENLSVQLLVSWYLSE